MTHTTRRSANVDSGKSPNVSQAQHNLARRAEQGGIELPPNPAIALYEFTPGSKRCQCMRCGLVFSTPGSFDRHQLLDDNGDAHCFDPASIGMVIRGQTVWGFPGDRPVELLRGESDNET